MEVTRPGREREVEIFLPPLKEQRFKGPLFGSLSPGSAAPDGDICGGWMTRAEALGSPGPTCGHGEGCCPDLAELAQSSLYD